MNATGRPLVSIGVPTCDRASLLERSLGSLVAQDYPNLEILVSDNASSDETPEVCARMQRRCPFIQYYRVPDRIPPFENFRNALVLSHGRYFVWASDDDLWEPDFVSSLVDQVERVDGLMLVAAEAQYVLLDGTKLPFFREGEAFYGLPPSSRARRILEVAQHSYGNLIYGVYRREALVDRAGGTVLDACRFFNEIPVFIQVAGRGGMRVCDRVLFYKTVPLRTYLQAAREYGVAARWEGAEPSGERSHSARVGLLSRAYRLVASDLHYHMRTLADIRRALWRIDAGLGLRLALLMVFTARLTGHFLKLVVVWPLQDILSRRIRV